MLGVSWEAMQQYHVALGYMFIAATFLHQILWWGFWGWQEKHLPEASKTICKEAGQMGSMPEDILGVPLSFHADNFSDPLIQIVWWTMVICMGVLLSRCALSEPLLRSLLIIRFEEPTLNCSTTPTM